MQQSTGGETAVVDALIAGSLTVSSLPNAELIAAVDELAARRRQLDAALAAAAGEVAARSDGLPAEDSLVRAAGHRSVRELLQHRIGIRSREAAVLCEVADATRSMVALSGSEAPAPFPQVAAALASGWIAVAQAHAITDTLGRSATRVSVDDLASAEQWLVQQAVGASDPEQASADDGVPMTPEVLAGLARHCLEHLDPDGAEPRYEEIVTGRFFRMRRLRDGSLQGEFRCTPEVGDAIQTLFDTEVQPRRVVFQDACGAADEPDAAEVDDRTRDQRRMDVLAAILTHHAATAAPKVADAAPTLTITVTADALRRQPTSLDDVPRLGHSGEPVPVSVAAAMLCDAAVQTLLLDDVGQPLRLGRTRRLFSKAQRQAIIARDRHCRAPGCTAPPAWCEAHHVQWWSNGGATDVDDGILLCRFHHTEVHRGTLVIERAAPAEPPQTTRGARRTRPRRWRVTATHRRRPRTRTPLRR